MIEQLRLRYAYLEDGTLFDRKRNRYVNGLRNGSSGHLRARFLNKLLYVHRVVFAIHHGFFPRTVDHIDRDPRNNRIENLRAVTHSQNCLNVGVRKDSTSKVRGVFKDKRDQTFYGQICVRGVVYNTGRSKCQFEVARKLDNLKSSLGVS